MSREENFLENPDSKRIPPTVSVPWRDVGHAARGEIVSVFSTWRRRHDHPGLGVPTERKSSARLHGCVEKDHPRPAK